MPIWNVNRNPDKYPAVWHSIVQSSPGKRLLDIVETPEEVLRLKNKFNAFKACLRNHPLHPTTAALAKRTLRLSVETLEGKHSVWVTINWSGDIVRLIEEQLV